MDLAECCNVIRLVFSGDPPGNHKLEANYEFVHNPSRR